MRQLPRHQPCNVRTALTGWHPVHDRHRRTAGIVVCRPKARHRGHFWRHHRRREIDEPQPKTGRARGHFWPHRRKLSAAPQPNSWALLAPPPETECCAAAEDWTRSWALLAPPPETECCAAAEDWARSWALLETETANNWLTLLGARKPVTPAPCLLFPAFLFQRHERRIAVYCSCVQSGPVSHNTGNCRCDRHARRHERLSSLSRTWMLF